MPIVSTLVGMVTVVNDVQPWKARSSIAYNDDDDDDDDDDNDDDNNNNDDNITTMIMIIVTMIPIIFESNIIWHGDVTHKLQQADPMGLVTCDPPPVLHVTSNDDDKNNGIIIVVGSVGYVGDIDKY